MTSNVSLVAEGLAFGESPRWRGGALYVSDMHANRIVSLTPGGPLEVVARFDGPVSGLGWLPDGRMLVVSMADRTLLRREQDGRFVVHADLSGAAIYRANDMVIAADGTAYVSSFGFELHPPSEPRTATIAKVDPDGAVSVAADNLWFPNGLAITPDGRTLIVAESVGFKLTAFDIGAGGALSNPRTWAAFAPGSVPDGICIDAEGMVWVSFPLAKAVMRIREGGAVLDTVSTDDMAIACMLGGDERTTLYIVTSEVSDPAECRGATRSRIVSAKVAVAGAGYP